MKYDELVLAQLLGRSAQRGLDLIEIGGPLGFGDLCGWMGLELDRRGRTRRSQHGDEDEQGLSAVNCDHGIVISI